MYNYQHAIKEADDALRILAFRSGKRTHLNTSVLTKLLQLASRKTFSAVAREQKGEIFVTSHGQNSILSIFWVKMHEENQLK